MSSFNQSTEVFFDPKKRRSRRRRQAHWSAFLRTLTLVLTVSLLFLGIYRLDRYRNGSEDSVYTVSALPGQSYGPAILWGGRH